jgi:hypothetical protein
VTLQTSVILVHPFLLISYPECFTSLAPGSAGADVMFGFVGRLQKQQLDAGVVCKLGCCRLHMAGLM